MEETEPTTDPIEPSADTPEPTAAAPEPPAETPEPTAAAPEPTAAAPEEPPAEVVPEQVTETPDMPAAESSTLTPEAPVAEPIAVALPAAAAAAPGRAARWLTFALLLVFTILTVAAFVGDYVLLALVPNGVTVVGREVNGLSAVELRAAIDESVSSPAMRPLTVTGDSRSWQLNPQGIVSVDVDAMIEEAYAPARNASMIERLWSRLSGNPLTAEVKPAYAVDKAALAKWVAETAETIDREPVDATRTVVKYAIRITPEVTGATLDQTRAVDEIAEALTAETALLPASRIAYLPIETVKPKVVAASFKRAIVVSLSRCRVYLYKGEKLVKTYPCAPGQPAWPTPKGDFVIARKQANAPWINPGTSWAASMPHSIPGGPGNPMGDRKIGINYPGVFLHGIPPSEYSSIGTHASHGCMRMMPSAIHDLYPRVRVGDPVYIRD